MQLEIAFKFPLTLQTCIEIAPSLPKYIFIGSTRILYMGKTRIRDVRVILT
ncbi:uncharacterized protein METZ01_LOCUS165277, partial [marine metagenome]